MKRLVRLVKHGNNYHVAGSELVVKPKPLGKLFEARTIGDVDDAASNFPRIPSPNAYSIEGAIGMNGSPIKRARVQLYGLSQGEYDLAGDLLESQRRSQHLV